MSREIILDNNYSIENDANNWVLVQKESKIAEKGKNAGKLYVSEDRRYYNNIQQCLQKYTDESLKPCKSADEIMKRLEEVEKVIIKVTR
jgi:uncharacterized protein Yka (UPF0111/DUF47 family)